MKRRKTGRRGFAVMMALCFMLTAVFGQNRIRASFVVNDKTYDLTDFEDYNFYVSGGSAYYKNSEGYSGRVVGGNSPVAAAIYRYVQQGYPSRMSG